MRLRRPCFCLVLLCANYAAAEPAGAKDARDVLGKASAAAAALSSVSYNAKLYAEGQFAGQFPAMSGKVLARKQGTGNLKQIRIDANAAVRTMTPEGPKESIESVTFVNDGTDIFLREDVRKRLTVGKASMASLQPVNMLYQEKFLSDAAFKDEMRGGTAVIEADAAIQGVECDVVSVKYDTQGMRTAKIYLGKKDNLLRRIETAIAFRMQGKQEITKGTVIFMIEGLDTKPKIEDSHFVLDCPAGYTRENMETEQPQQKKNTIAVGADAPDWEMQTPEGAKVTLKSLRGKFVILDFWATWCGPCKMAMPGMQKMHERFKGKPIVVYGANCWERSAQADPMAYVKSKNFTYPQLLKADQAAGAYGVTGIPAIFLIDPDGKIMHVVRGYDPQTEETFAKLIEEKLNPK